MLLHCFWALGRVSHL